jgi:protein involved in polysaccharide export with SLBB domain
MKTIRILIVICFVIAIGGFQSAAVFGQEKQKTSNSGKETVNSTETVKPEVSGDGISESTKKEISKVENEQIAFENRGDDRYRIGFQDTLDVQVFKHPELSQTLSVNPDGTIRLFRIENPVVAVCKTERELAYTIETLYKNYLRTPQVNVRAIDQRSQPFAVMGAVEKPGSFFLNKKVRLIQLLSLAGGYSVEFAGMKIQVARIGNLAGCSAYDSDVDNNKEVQFLTFNLADVIEGRQNPWMEPGDIVSVLKAEEAYVIGDVIEPSKVELKGPVTLTQAIAIAKGLDKNARTNKVTIERQTPGSPIKTELVFDLKEIRDKKVPDPLLQANDIVIVATDKGKAFKGGLLKALTGGLPNLFYKFPL